MYQPFVDAALDACKEVAHHISNHTSSADYLPQEVGAGGDVSIGFDLTAETIFVRHLSPFGTISSEESGIIGPESDLLIILDPIDGSENIKAKFPYYGASIALQHRGETVVGIIVNFANGDCFVHDGEKHYRTSVYSPSVYEAVQRHEHGRIGLFEKAYEHPEMVAALKQAGLKFRSPGAVALSLAYAHYVKYVLFFGTMRSYDLEAGLFLCKELYVYQEGDLLIVSADQATYQQLLQLFQRSSSEHSRSF